MSIKADWDMNINLNKLIKDVETNPRDFYDKVEPETRKLKKFDEFPYQTTRRGNYVTDTLRSLDKEHHNLEKKLAKPQKATIEDFENLTVSYTHLTLPTKRIV